MVAPYIIETERQRLRPMGREDAESLHELNADPEVNRFTHDGPFGTLEEMRVFAEKYESVYRDEGMGRWGCYDRETGEFLGWCGLRRQPSGEVDLGYRYRRAAWGRGLATEAARACVDYAFRELGLTRLIATADPANVASIRIFEKLGFRFDRSEITPEGHDDVVYVLDRPA